MAVSKNIMVQMIIFHATQKDIFFNIANDHGY